MIKEILYVPSDEDKDPIINIDVEEDTNQKELIEQDLDNSPEDFLVDEYINNIPTPEIIPSYKDFKDWRDNQIEYEELINILKERYQNEVVIPYRKELREWWFNRQKSKVNG